MNRAATSASQRSGHILEEGLKENENHKNETVLWKTSIESKKLEIRAQIRRAAADVPMSSSVAKGSWWLLREN